MKLNNKGQSVVEYLLLMGVLVSLGLVVFKHPKFQDILGPDSNVFRGMKKFMTYSYRHARPGTDGNADLTGASHDSFMGGGRSRFFAPKEKYPK